MFKKILITILCLYFIAACRRKGDPEYQANLNKQFNDYYEIYK